MKKSEKKDLAKIITPKFRVAFPHVFKASAMKDDTDTTKRYSITMLFKKNQDLSSIRTAIAQAKTEAFGDKKDWPENIESPVRDGDEMDYEGFEGCYAIKASTREDFGAPGVVDEEVNKIIDAGQFYAGCYAIAAVYARVWKFGKKIGVGFYLDHVQKVADGKPFGGRKPVDQVFSPVTENEKDDDSDFNEEDGF